MIPSQILKSSLDELSAITHVDLFFSDATGSRMVHTAGARELTPEEIISFMTSEADSMEIGDSLLMKVLEDGEPRFCLAVSGGGDAIDPRMVLRIAVSELQQLLPAFRERYDQNSFFQNLLLDNLLRVDIYSRAKRLHIENNLPRAVILLEAELPVEPGDNTAHELLGQIFTPESGDYLVDVDEKSLAIIKTLAEGEDADQVLMEAAQVAVDMLAMEAMLPVRAAYGTVGSELRELSGSFKEARMAMDVGRIFYAEKTVISFRTLGIGRLIYQLPVSLCHLFLDEIFGEEGDEVLDAETVTTINTFFDHSLNVSETARHLYVHRNTLVYRIEKVQRLTGLDVRSFDDALTFKIALMVRSYLSYLKTKQN